jgi:hypothetical protein
MYKFWTSPPHAVNLTHLNDFFGSFAGQIYEGGGGAMICTMMGSHTAKRGCIHIYIEGPYSVDIRTIWG